MSVKETALVIIAILNVLFATAQKSNYSELITKKANLVEQKVIA